MNIRDKITERIDSLKEQIGKFEALLELIGPDGFEVEKCTVSFDGYYIDFDNPTRADVEQILKHVRAGKWNKAQNMSHRGGLNYISDAPVIGDNPIRLWAAEPPNTCRIVEEEVEVPKTIIPAHKETRKRLVCNKAQPETEAVTA